MITRITLIPLRTRFRFNQSITTRRHTAYATLRRCASAPLAIGKSMNDIEYEHKANELYSWASALFRARENDASILEAALIYFNKGEQEGFSTGELVDFLGVSSPSVLSTAGFTDDEEVRIMELISKSAESTETSKG